MINTYIENKWFKGVDLLKDPVLNRYGTSEREQYVQDYISANIALANSSSEFGERILFTDDIWDFTNVTQEGQKSNYSIFDFSRFPESIKTKVKYYVMDALLRKEIKLSTIYIRYTTFTSILISIMNKKQDFEFDSIATRDIEDEIERRNLKAYSKHSAFLAIRQFYEYLILKCHYNLPVNIERLTENDETAVKTSKTQDNRLPNIPKQYAKILEDTIVSVMRNNVEKYSSRLVACAIIMFMKLGVRLIDLLDFKTDNLKTQETAGNRYIIYTITYFIHKITRHNCEDFGHEIYSSSLCTEAFKTMLEIRETQVASRDNMNLFCMDKNKKLTKAMFSSEYRKFMFSHLHELCTDKKWNEYFKPCKYGKEIIYIPDTRQYRVWICNELLSKGVSWNFIEEHLKHLTETMIGYYARPEDKTEEYIGYAENVLKEIVIDNLTPIGTFGSEIKANIKNFLLKNRVNTSGDFDEIYEKLSAKVAIRAKTGGFCFKTSLVPCSQESGNNRMACSFDLCPNIYSFYYMIDISYSDFRGNIEAYEQNIMKGLTRAAAKELAAAKSLIYRKLEPQFEQLEKEIASKGIETIAELHPNIIDIIQKMPQIKKEIKEWKIMK